MARFTISAFLLGLGFLLAGCGGKPRDKAAAGQPREVTKAVQAEAETQASDAVFAMQIRDYARAEKGWKRALELRPDIPEWWESYGTVAKRLGKTGDTRGAYKKALGIWEQRYEATKDPQFGLHQIFALVLLGRADDARSLTERLGKAHPTDPMVRNFVTGHGVDQVLADPDMQQNKL